MVIANVLLPVAKPVERGSPCRRGRPELARGIPQGSFPSSRLPQRVALWHLSYFRRLSRATVYSRAYHWRLYQRAHKAWPYRWDSCNVRHAAGNSLLLHSPQEPGLPRPGTWASTFRRSEIARRSLLWSRMPFSGTSPKVANRTRKPASRMPRTSRPNGRILRDCLSTNVKRSRVSTRAIAS